MPPPGRPRRFAFTLIELLVVIAVIAVLAALLLPVLGRAKAAGQSTACKSNLHQIGIALSLYTSESQKYPVAASTDPGPRGAQITLWDAKLLPFASNNRELFFCLANRSAPPWTNNVAVPIPNPSYGYNFAGSGRYPTSGPSLGLDGGENFRGPSKSLSENQVKAPSDMIAVADATPRPGGEDHDLDDLFPINLLMQVIPARHNQGANAVFCDAHVEFAKLSNWLQKSERARQRWNNDHQSHPETWSNNP